MALFDESTIVDSGVELLNAQLAGQRLTVTSAYAGTGYVDKELLHAQTELKDQRQKTVLVSLESYEDHKRIRVQLSNTGLAQGYTLNQLLINAVLDSAENSEETALLIMQDPKGIEIPSESESPGFELEIYCVLLVTNKLQIGLIVDPAGTVKFKDLKRTMESHDMDKEAHGDIRQALKEVREAAESAGKVRPGEGPPGPELEAEAGDRYFDSAAGREYICTGTQEEDGERRTLWKEAAYQDDLEAKQDKITGTPGQVPVFNEEGDLEAQDFSGSAVFAFAAEDWGPPASWVPEEPEETQAADEAGESGGAEGPPAYDGSLGYEIAIPPETHKRKSGDFGFQVFHQVEGKYITNTWAALGTGADYDGEAGTVTLSSADPYPGKILFVG